MDRRTLNNIFHVYCFYRAILKEESEPRMSRNKLVYDNRIQNHYESFIDCLKSLCSVRNDVSLYSFYQFVVDAVNSLNEQERILIYERYLHKDHYKSNRKHYIALGMKPHQYDKLLQSAREKLIKHLGIDDLQLTIPDWMKR